MAIGECACASVHGANRLGTNSLLDIVVFGRAAAIRASETLTPGATQKPLPPDGAERALSVWTVCVTPTAAARPRKSAISCNAPCSATPPSSALRPA